MFIESKVIKGHVSSYRRLGIAVATALAFSYSNVAPADNANDAGPAHDGNHAMEMTNAMKDNMAKMQAMPMSGDADHDFAMKMKMHHQGAIEMADLELHNGKDAKLRRMAKNIISSQKKEIKEFDQWLENHEEHTEKK